MRLSRRIIGVVAAALLAVTAPTARAITHSLADHVKDTGPAAEIVRESLRCLEHGEEALDDATKLKWYAEGKALAARAVAKDDHSADAHFALFANWGRLMQTEGWVKNAFRLPELQQELDRALELNPNHADALASKGGLYCQLPRFLGGDPAKGEPLLKRAIEMDPLAVGARLELAELYLGRDDPDTARPLAEKAMELARDQGKFRFVRKATQLLDDIGPGPAQSAARR
jgi:tetratricopeptide (TPR) repeat protein